MNLAQARALVKLLEDAGTDDAYSTVEGRENINSEDYIVRISPGSTWMLRANGDMEEWD